MTYCRSSIGLLRMDPAVWSRAASPTTDAVSLSHGRSRQRRGSRSWGFGPRVSDIPPQTYGRMCRPRCLLLVYRSKRTKPLPFRPTAAGCCSSDTTPLGSNSSTLFRSTWPPRRSRSRTPTARPCPSGHPTATRSDFLDKASSRRLMSRQDKSERSPTPGKPAAAPGTATT